MESISERGLVTALRRPQLLTASPSSFMDSAPAATLSFLARARERAYYALLALGVRLVQSGLPELVYRFAIVPLYYVKILVLTITAYVSGKSFIVRLPHQLPRFIGRPWSQDLYPFVLTPGDRDIICNKTGVYLQPVQTRRWEPSREVFKKYAPHIPPIGIDLTPYHVVGSRLIQGQGFIGHGICGVLMKELGRWPGRPGFIAGEVFSWKEGELVIGRIPIKLLAVAGVEETVQLDNGHLRLVWQDLETGMTNGIQATLIPPAINVAFANYDAFGNIVDDNASTYSGDSGIGMDV
jgi:hypothetical protein